VTEPIFWLVCSFLLVAVCLTAVLMTAIPALRELARASRSAERLFDTLYKELPPTLESIRLTGSEISGLTDDLSGGVESAGNVVKQVDQGLRVAQHQVKEASIITQSFWTGVRVAWKTLIKPSSKHKHRRTRSVGQSSEESAYQGAQNHPKPAGDRPSPTFQQQPSAPLSTVSIPPKGAAHAVEQRLELESEHSTTPESS
jgi:hypothetical protein